MSKHQSRRTVSLPQAEFAWLGEWCDAHAWAKAEVVTLLLRGLRDGRIVIEQAPADVVARAVEERRRVNPPGLPPARFVRERHRRRLARIAARATTKEGT